MSLADLFRSVVSLSLLGSLLALGILFIQRLFRPKLSAHWHYALWFVLILRLLIPLTLPSSFSVLNPWPSLRQTFPLSQALSTQPFSSSPQKALTSTPPTTHMARPEVGNLPSAGKTPVPSPTRATLGLNWLTAAFVWLGGVFLLFTYILVVNGWLLLKSKKQSLCEAPEVREILRECQLTLQVRSKISVIYDDSLKSPALFGLIRPKIVISPKLLAELAPEELRYIFLHELSHLKRRDHWVNAWVTLVQVVYWFNPLIGYALRHMKQDCEMACDATALAVVRPEEHRQYGQTIIRLLQLLSEPHWAHGTMGFANTFNKRRIIMIASFKKATVKWTVAALALTLVVGCSSLSNPVASTVSAPGQTANTTTNAATHQTKTTTGNHTQSPGLTPPTANSATGNHTKSPNITLSVSNSATPSSPSGTPNVESSIETPRGVVWDPRPSMNSNGTAVPSLLTPFSLYLSPSNVKPLQASSAEKILTLSLTENTPAGQFYVYLNNYFYSDNWIVYSICLMKPGMAQPYINQLRAVNLDNKRDVLITNFYDAGGDFFAVASDNNLILFSQKSPGAGVTYLKQVNIFDLDNGQKSPADTKDLRLIPDKSILKYQKDGQTLTFQLQLGSSMVALN